MVIAYLHCFRWNKFLAKLNHRGQHLKAGHSSSLELPLVAISMFNCKPGKIMLIDILFKGRVSVHIKKRICFIMNSEEREIKLKVAGVRQQTNDTDCGLYAIAFINHILHYKEYLYDVKFNQSKMCHHLLRSYFF